MAVYDEENRKGGQNYWEGDKGSATAQDLKEQEEAPSVEEQSANSEEDEHETPENAGFYNAGADEHDTPRLGGFGGGASAIIGSVKKVGKKKGGLIALGLAPILVLFVLIILILGQLKAVNFATIMRSAGFATFQLTMNKAFSQVVFDHATLTDTSTGKLKLGKDPLRFIQNRLTDLGNQGKLKFDVASGGDVNSIIVNGETFSFDSYSQKLFSKDYSKLSVRERWTVQSQMASDMSDPLSQITADNNLFYRSRVFTGIRQTANISMIKWVNAAKDFIGKTPQEAEKANIEDDVDYVNGGPLSADCSAATISCTDVQEQAKEVEDAAENGLPTKDVAASDKDVKAKIAGTAAKTSIIVFGVTLACMVNDLSNSFNTAQQQHELGSLRMGHEAMTMADQEESGDAVSEATSAESVDWGGADQSVWYKQDTGQQLTSADQQSINQLPAVFPPLNGFEKAVQWAQDAIKTLIQGPILAEFGHYIPGYQKAVQTAQNGVCDVAMNGIVQWSVAAAQTGVAIFTGGLEEAGQEAAQAALGMVIGNQIGTAIDNLTKNLSNTDFSGVATGSDRYDQSRAGVQYLNATANRQMAFGAPLTSQQSATDQQVAMDNVQQQNKNASVYQKYFAVANPYSLTGQIVDKMPSSFAELGSNLSDAVASLESVLINPVKTVGALLSPHAFADATNNVNITGANVGIQDFGYTQAEIQQIDTDPSFSLSALTKTLAPQMAQLDAKYMPCYTPVLESQLPGFTQTMQTGTPTQCLDPNFYQGQLVLKWRWYHALQTACTESARPLSAFIGGQDNSTDPCGSLE